MAAIPATAKSWVSGPAELWADARAVLRVHDLNHHYGEGDLRKQVLFENYLAVAPGEIVIMTGPSGSGKTTLLTLIGALRTVQDGSLQVLGHELAGRSTRELVEVRRNIGFIFQAHNLFESLTAYQNVRMALELQTYTAAAMNDRIVQVLTQLGLSHRIQYKPDKLSGGQRQRVAIARALANRPKLILADEPTAALDEKSGRDVVRLFQELAQQEKSTIIIVTHDNRILDVADRIVNMVDGRIKSNVRVKESVAIAEFLSKCPAFAALTPDSLSKVIERLMKELYPAGSIIFRQGDPGDKFYLIRSGAVDVVIDAGSPAQRVVATLKEGDFFGEMALLTGEPRNATIVVKENLEAFTLEKGDFTAALEASESFREQMRKMYFQRQ